MSRLTKEKKMKQERALMRLLKLNKLILGYSFNNLNDLKITWLDNSTTVLDQNGKVVMSSKTDWFNWKKLSQKEMDREI